MYSARQDSESQERSLITALSVGRPPCGTALLSFITAGCRTRSASRKRPWGTTRKVCIAPTQKGLGSKSHTWRTTSSGPCPRPPFDLKSCCNPLNCVLPIAESLGATYGDDFGSDVLGVAVERRAEHVGIVGERGKRFAHSGRGGEEALERRAAEDHTDVAIGG